MTKTYDAVAPHKVAFLGLGGDGEHPAVRRAVREHKAKGDAHLLGVGVEELEVLRSRVDAQRALGEDALGRPAAGVARVALGGAVVRGRAWRRPRN